jgi:hypothetical protein
LRRGGQRRCDRNSGGESNFRHGVPLGCVSGQSRPGI